MPGTDEAFSRVKIDAQLKDQGWDVLNPNAVRFEYVLPDQTKADYVLCDRHGRALAVIEAKRAAINPAEAEAQAKTYAAQLEVPYVFLANGEEIRFWEWQREAFPAPSRRSFRKVTLNAVPQPGMSGVTHFRFPSTSTSSSAITKPSASKHSAGRSIAAGARCSLKWRPAPARRGPPRP
jgi:hypothetical protein